MQNNVCRWSIRKKFKLHFFCPSYFIIPWFTSYSIMIIQSIWRKLNEDHFSPLLYPNCIKEMKKKFFLNMVLTFWISSILLKGKIYFCDNCCKIKVALWVPYSNRSLEWRLRLKFALDSRSRTGKKVRDRREEKREVKNSLNWGNLSGRQSTSRKTLRQNYFSEIW